MSSIIRIRNSVMEGLLPELLAGIAPELEKYPQQLRLTMIPPVYGEAVQSNGRSWAFSFHNPLSKSFPKAIMICMAR